MRTRNLSPTPSSRPRAALRVALLVILVMSTALALLGQPRLIAGVRTSGLSPEWLLVAPGLFVLFVLVTGADLALLARRRGFVSGRSLLQVGFALAFLAMLTPQAFFEYRTRKASPLTSDALLESLVQSRDARVRALVMEAAGGRAPGVGMGRLLKQGLRDADPLVRDTALRAVERLQEAPLEGSDRVQDAMRIISGWQPEPASHSVPARPEESPKVP